MTPEEPDCKSMAGFKQQNTQSCFYKQAKGAHFSYKSNFKFQFSLQLLSFPPVKFMKFPKCAFLNLLKQVLWVAGIC
jgi:hypothetical protein